jgi:hypothetical protein
MKFQENTSKRGEYFFRSGLEEFGHGKPQIAKILFRKASYLGHESAERLIKLLNEEKKCKQ